MQPLDDHDACDLITPDQAAAMLGLSPRSLARWVGEGNFPAPYRLSPRRCRYRRSEVREWIESRRPTG